MQSDGESSCTCPARRLSRWCHGHTRQQPVSAVLQLRLANGSFHSRWRACLLAGLMSASSVWLVATACAIYSLNLLFGCCNRHKTRCTADWVLLATRQLIRALTLQSFNHSLSVFGGHLGLTDLRLGSLAIDKANWLPQHVPERESSTHNAKHD